MIICQTTVIIVQKPSFSYPNRTKTITFPFVVSFEAENSWRNMTDKATITLPKNIFYLDANNIPVNLGNSNANIGGFSASDPLFLKGDAVTINAGYKTFDKLGNPNLLMGSPTFAGFISKVTSKKPFVLECEDAMFQLKQIPAPNKLFPAASYTVEKMLAELLTGTIYTVNQQTQTNIGDWTTQNETVADVLARLRKDKFLESYFRGNQLRCGSLVYIEAEAVTHTYTFQQTIISDDLEYQRKDDIILSAICNSINTVSVGGTTRDGNARTQQQRLEVLITLTAKGVVKNIRPLGSKADFPPANVGERRTLNFANVTDVNVLANLGVAKLQQYYYTGLRGKFLTFGMPFARQGDNAQIVDNKLPERNGTYKIKSVKYTGGTGGLRQEIELDYKLP